MRLVLPIAALLLALLLFPFAHAATPVPAPPSVDVSAYILMDFATGRVLAERNADARLEPASLTKIMTIYVAAGELRKKNIHLDDAVKVSELAWKTGGSRMFLEPDKPVKLQELLYGIVVQSGNDASVALAEHVSGSVDVFTQLMNQEAQRLGLEGTHFANPEGLPDPENYSTARDMAKLGAALIRDYPEVYKIYSTREFTYNNIVQHNRNKTLTLVDGADGIKTGHTDGAGYCLVASARRGDMRLLSVVLGASSDKVRTQASRALLEYGFRFFEGRPLYKAGQKIASVHVFKGERRDADLGLLEDLNILVPRGRYQDIKVAMELARASAVAPLARGDAEGKLKVTLDDDILAERSLVVLTPVAPGSLLQRLVDQVWMLVE